MILDFMMKWLIFVTLIIIWITYASISKSEKGKTNVKGRAEISEVIEEHPFAVNPIIWVTIISYIFMGFAIVYYATSF